MKVILKLFRVKHYIKNLLIFLPLIFSGQMVEKSPLLRGAAGFLCFCAVSSAVYIVNDIFDAEKDRLHPVKKNRPIASGAVSAGIAAVLAAVLAAASLAADILFFKPGWTTACLAAYIAINILYSAGLKKVPLLDIAILSTGFLLRVYYGGALSGVEVSNWLYLTVLFFSFFLSLGKRRGELAYQGDKGRDVLARYTPGFLDKVMYMCLTLTIVFYSFWCVDPAVTAKYGGKALIWSIPALVLVCMRYCMSVEGTSDGDPVEVLLKDKLLIALCVVYAALMGVIIYFPA